MIEGLSNSLIFTSKEKLILDFRLRLSMSSFANLFSDISKLSNEDLKKIQTRGILNIENEYSLQKVKKEVLEDFKALFV